MSDRDEGICWCDEPCQCDWDEDWPDDEDPDEDPDEPWFEPYCGPPLRPVETVTVAGGVL